MSGVTTPPKALTEKAQQISAKQKELHEILQKHRTDEGEYKMSEEVRQDCENRNKELNDLGKAYETEYGTYQIAAENEKRAAWLNEPVNRLPHQFDEKEAAYMNIGGRKPGKSLGEIFTESAEYKGYDKQSKSASMSVELEGALEQKTLLTTATGWAVQAPPIMEVLGGVQRRLVVADLLPQQGISQPIASWMEMTTRTNNAAVVAEGATKPESAMAWTRRDSTAKKIANSIPVTTEQLEDIPQIQGVINSELVLMVQYAEEVELLNGDGTGAHLLGFTQLPNILTQARGADNNVDALFKLFTQIRFTGTNTVFAEPSGVVLHPTNWQTIRLMKETGTGAYIWGPPSESGDERVWGKPVVVTPAITENTGLTGDFRLYSKLFRYKNIRIEVGWVNTQFIENERTILAEERVILAVKKQTAFGLATGLN